MVIRRFAVASALSGLAAFTVAGLGMAAADASSAPPQPKPKSSAEIHTLAAQTASKLVGDRPAALHAAAGDSFVQHRVISSSGLQYVPYERKHDGLAVVGGDFVVVTDANGAVRSTSVAQDRSIGKLSTKPTVAAAKAASIARHRLTTVRTAGTPRLVVHALGTPKLAWETVVSGTRGKHPSKQDVYVDAHTGKLISAKEKVLAGDGTSGYNGPNPVKLNTSGSGGSFTMTDPSITNLSCNDLGSGDVLSGPDDNWGDGDATMIETGCVDALFGAQTEAKMLSEWLGRNGMDGNGGAWPINVGLDDLNAFYDGSQVQIGHNQDNQWIGSIDVIAHEMGHGIDDHTPGGISGGGTQEFVADAFGATTEAYANEPADFDAPDFTVGEEINLVGSGPIRNMYDPSQVGGDPNCYSSAIPGTEVHAAAGPGNHWFYLLAQGNKPAGGPESPTCNSSDVTGIGIQNAAKVLYNAMLIKTSDSSYLKYRTWTLTAAKNLFPGSCTEFNAVKAAWDAVDVPAQSDEPTCEGGGAGAGGGGQNPNPAGTDFTGIAALSNCSASVVRFADSQPGEPALGLTNGHCYEGGMPEPGEVLTNQPSTRSFTLLGKDGSDLGTVHAAKLLYSTMTKTDVSLYQLDKTYQQLADGFDGFTPLTLSDKSPADGTSMAVVSGYWKRVYTCSVAKTVHQLKEAGWTMEQSVKYQQPGCETIGGTSGSPVVDTATGQVIGANNTGNEDGEQCTLNNPCEVDENGTVTVEKGSAYGQQTAWFYTCLAADHTLDLTKEGCLLPAPQTLRSGR